MKKLIFSFCCVFFVLIFIWSIMGFIQHGFDINEKHLDFKRTISQLMDTLDYDLSDVTESIKSFGEISTFDGDPIAKIGLFLETIFIKPITLGLDMLKLLFNFILAVFNFIFNPVFI